MMLRAVDSDNVESYDLDFVFVEEELRRASPHITQSSHPPLDTPSRNSVSDGDIQMNSIKSDINCVTEKRIDYIVGWVS
jgi:hypothetical protein